MVLTVNKQHETALKESHRMGNRCSKSVLLQVGNPSGFPSLETRITTACEELSFLHNGKLADQFVLSDSWTTTSCGSKSSLARLMPFRDTITLSQLEAGLAVALFIVQIISSREEKF